METLKHLHFFRTTVRVGEHKLSTNPDCTSDDKDAICAEPPQDYKIAKIIFHPKYNTPNPFRNDIAILQLNDTVVENGNEVISFFCRPHI